MQFDFVDATRESILIKTALCGPPGAGKTRSALGIATHLARILDLGDIYLIDSENRSSSKYAYDPKSGTGFKFKALYLPKDDYSPQTYMRAIEAAEKRGARIIIIDSLSHAWNGVKGILEQVDSLTEASRSKNAFSEGWKKATPIQRRFIQTILDSPAHILATMRSDPDWIVQENDRGKKEPTMVGLSPQQRKDIAFEFDIVLNLNRDHNAVVDKTRCEALNENGAVWRLPGENVARVLADWIGTSDPRAVELESALGAAIAEAVTAGLVAAETKNPEAYKQAKQKLSAWCEAHGVPAHRRDAALAQFRDRVAAVTTSKAGAAPANGAPAQSSDEERMRAIDEGRA